MGIHQAQVDCDYLAGKHAQHCVKASANSDYSNIGTDSPVSVTKTITNVLVTLRAWENTPTDLPNSQASDLICTMSTMAVAINGVAMNSNKRPTFRQIRNGPAYFLQTAANLLASASDVCFDESIIDLAIPRHPITDDHTAFDEYFNLLRQVTPMCEDLKSAQPSYMPFQSSYLLQIQPSNTTANTPQGGQAGAEEGKDGKQRKRRRNGQEPGHNKYGKPHDTAQGKRPNMGVPKPRSNVSWSGSKVIAPSNGLAMPRRKSNNG
jgi:hypothetical protein